MDDIGELNTRVSYTFGKKNGVLVALLRYEKLKEMLQWKKAQGERLEKERIMKKHLRPT
jgi:hypothetical protein